MVVEMNEILRQQVSRPAVSCMPVDSHGGSDVGVSFLDHVIAPLYEVVSAVCFLKSLFQLTCNQCAILILLCYLRGAITFSGIH